jgi:hypothetical protein
MSQAAGFEQHYRPGADHRRRRSTKPRRQGVPQLSGLWRVAVAIAELRALGGVRLTLGSGNHFFSGV